MESMYICHLPVDFRDGHSGFVCPRAALNALGLMLVCSRV